MEVNNPAQEVKPDQVIQEPSAEQPLKQKGYFLPILISIVVLVVIIAGGYFLYQKQAKPVTAPQQISQPTQSPTSSDETANWKTYTRNNTFKIEYPPHIKVYWDESNDSFIQFYREDVVDPKGAGQSQGQIDPDRLCCGLSIYLRSPNGMEEMESRPQEDTTVAQYSASRWTDNPMYMEDVWVKSPKENIVVRFSITTTGELPEYQKEDFETYKQILSTFKFLDVAGNITNWKTYINADYGYQLKHPKTLSTKIPDNASQVFIVYFTENQDEYLEVEISGISSLGLNKEIEFDMQRANPSKTTLQSKPAVSIRPARNIYPGEPFKATIVYLEDKKFKIELGYYGDGKNEALFDQILSTFKFTQ